MSVCLTYRSLLVSLLWHRKKVIHLEHDIQLYSNIKQIRRPVNSAISVANEYKKQLQLYKYRSVLCTVLPHFVR